VVCGIPLVLLPLAEQRRFIDAVEAVAPGSRISCITATA
jgi:phosphatidylethanolamine/phosphatidyl-N-methylethanolamine N-methyltransferase